jgi:hypothetical protein
MRAFVVLWFCSACLAADRFDLPATFVRHGRDRAGDLHIDSTGVQFRSKDGKAAITVPMSDLRTVSVADPKAIQFEIYAISKWNPADRVAYRFRVAADAPLEDLARFFTDRLNRPVVGHYEQSARFQIPAFHRGLRRATSGMLEIGDAAITFASEQPSDSRTWLYRDIETIGQPDSYRFRVTTARETYVLELKRRLSAEAYRLAWKNVYEAERSAK